MQRLPTALLLHETRTGGHHDWLLTNPRDPAGPLWTARVGPPSHHWSRLQRWDLQPIGAHRRAYLDYEGPLTNDRGRIRRVDAGWIIPHLWTTRRIVLTLDTRFCRGDIQLQRISAALWRASWLSERATSGGRQGPAAAPRRAGRAVWRAMHARYHTSHGPRFA